MRFLTVVFFAAVLSAGCSKDRSEDNRVSQNAVQPDNSARNAEDQKEQNKTAGDQSENEADRTISQNVRAAITADDTLSIDGKNVKIITSDGTVTLRGPVKSVKEKSEIEAKAKQIVGVKKVDNQLEIAS